MSDRDDAKPAPSTSPLRIYLPLIALFLAGLWAYFDLRTETAELRGRLDARGGRAGVSSTTPITRAVGERGPDASPLRHVESREGDAGPEAPREEWSCTGHIASEMVRTALGNHGRDVFTCYEQVASHTPGLRGTLVLELKVDGRGAVEDARVQGTLQHPELLSCLSLIVFDWRFPPPVGGDCAIVSAPFRLEPAGEEES